MTGVQHDYVITMQRRLFYWPDGRHGCVKHAGSGRDLSLSASSSVVCNFGTEKLVCNKRKSVLSESVLTTVL